MKSEKTAAHILVKGRVQGVGYRFFVQEAAAREGLNGWVRNLPGGDVEAMVEGPHPAVERFVEDLRKGPPMARVETVNVSWIASTSKFKGFSISG